MPHSSFIKKFRPSLSFRKERKLLGWRYTMLNKTGLILRLDNSFKQAWEILKHASYIFQACKIIFVYNMNYGLVFQSSPRNFEAYFVYFSMMIILNYNLNYWLVYKTCLKNISSSLESFFKKTWKSLNNFQIALEKTIKLKPSRLSY